MDQKTYYAKLKWENGTPRSMQYQDVYFSTHGPLEESDYVFIKHNQLKERFSKLRDNDLFVIGEAGFGCGINLMSTIKLWQECVNTKARLFFISFEANPLCLDDLKIIWKKLPGFEKATTQLFKQYNLILPGTHRLYFEHNIFFDLIIGDITSTINLQKFIADAWFLDGFCPSKNQEMWSENLFRQIARLSRPNATFATYSAASIVKDHLQKVGFIVKKSAGFNKREMLYGHLFTKPDLSIKKTRLGLNKPTPWFDNYHNKNLDKKVIIIGGGISGAATAYALSKRSYQITLYEKNPELARNASGNYQGILYGTFYGDHKHQLELAYSGYQYSYNLITQILDNNSYQRCGLIELALTDKEQIQQKKLLNLNLPKDFCRYIDSDEISKLTPITNQQNGIYFSHGLWLNPPSFVNKLCNNINVKLNEHIEQISFNTRTKNWEIIQNGKILDSAPNLVICNADHIDDFEVLKAIPIRKIHGQVSIVHDQINLQTIVCGNGYIIPQFNNKFTMGATFKFDNTNTCVNDDEHLENIENILQFMPEIKDKLKLDKLSGKAGVRVSTTDYLPLVGPVAKYDKFKHVYRDLTKDANYWIDTPCPYLEGLYINVGHGAKGILSAPISGEIIASYIDNSPLPISDELRKALHPNRFWKQSLIKKLHHL